jgi:DNA-binding transcriptional LysR family regulator
MHIRNLDLNLLKVAAALYKHRNVSKAADQLGLSQSAVSHALSRLRTQFDDPLFVRTSKGMALTGFATKIQSDIMEIIRRLELLAMHENGFDPKTARNRITIASTDYFEITALPALLKILEIEAPHLQISLRPTRGELPKKELEEGSINMAIAGFYKDLPEGFYQSKVFSDYFVTAAGEKSSLFQEITLSEKQFYSARHALITLQGDFKESSSNKKTRNITYGSYSFTGMAWVIQESGLLLTAPNRLIQAYKTYFPLKVWESPIKRDRIDIRMVWHAQTHQDQLHVWLRSKIKKIFDDKKK